ncbi:hypothetical protein R2255_003753 [Cronobacter dublinensis]|nr:hypothetical protein [Cronobacter dublinensis]
MSTIGNERLEKIAAGGGFNFNEVEAISAELLALRKERDRAEPVAWLVCGSKTYKDRTASTREVAEQAVKDRNDGSGIKPLYTVPPAPVVPEGWKLVPVEPTKEMVAKMRYHNGGYDKHIKNGYAAMLAAAPEPCK